jgi:hypothetical protein
MGGIRAIRDSEVEERMGFSVTDMWSWMGLICLVLLPICILGVARGWPSMDLRRKVSTTVKLIATSVIGVSGLLPHKGMNAGIAAGFVLFILARLIDWRLIASVEPDSKLS